MTETIEVTRLDHVQVRIVHDDSPSDPRENDNLGTLVCWHRRYSLGEKHTYQDTEHFYLDLVGTEVAERLDRWFEREYAKLTGVGTAAHEEARKALNSQHRDKLLVEVEKVAIILPVYMYDHSGIVLNTTGFSCPWDSGQVGFIYITKEKARKEFGRLTKKALELVEKGLRGEVEEYSLYVSGQCYGYIVESLPSEEEIEDYGDQAEGDELESCWSFLGIEYCREEALSSARHENEHLRKEKETKNAALVLFTEQEVGHAVW